MYIRALFLFIAILFITGCSTSFLYNRLDWFIPWYIDDYVDLNREQKQNFKLSLQPVLDWHRAEELLVYIELLDQIERDLTEPITKKTVENWGQQFLQAIVRIEDQMLPVLYKTGDELNDDQIKELIDNMWARQSEYEEEYLSRTDEQYSEDNFDRLIENLSDYLGPLSAEQNDQIGKAAGSLKRFDQVWLDERKVWFKSLQQIMQRQPGWQHAFSKAYAERKKNRTTEYHAYLEHNMDIFNLAIAKVINLRSEKQNKHLKREIDKLRADIQFLIAKSDAAL